MPPPPCTTEQAGGCLIPIVGPSGVGKDTLIEKARRAFGDRHDIMFVRRTITRPADAGGEDHEAVDQATFQRRLADGAFAVHWRAHGLSYGIPNSVRYHVEAGGLAVVNGSRHAMPAIARAFPALHVVEITADPAILARRLAVRGRETAEMIAARLRRPRAGAPGLPLPTEIDNSGSPEEAAARLVALIGKLATGD